MLRREELFVFTEAVVDFYEAEGAAYCCAELSYRVLAKRTSESLEAGGPGAMIWVSRDKARNRTVVDAHQTPSTLDR